MCSCVCTTRQTPMEQKQSHLTNPMDGYARGIEPAETIPVRINIHPQTPTRWYPPVKCECWFMFTPTSMETRSLLSTINPCYVTMWPHGQDWFITPNNYRYHKPCLAYQTYWHQLSYYKRVPQPWEISSEPSEPSDHDSDDRGTSPLRHDRLRPAEGSLSSFRVKSCVRRPGRRRCQVP